MGISVAGFGMRGNDMNIYTLLDLLQDTNDYIRGFRR